MVFFSEKLSGEKLNYNTYDVEFYAVVLAVRYWRHYLFHRILFCTHHNSLRHLHQQNKVSPCHARWVVYLEQFTYVVIHKAGIANMVADALNH